LKFSYGYWVNKTGVNVNGAVDLRAFENRGGVWTAFVSCAIIQHRGQTLQGPLITIEFSSPLENVIDVRAYHYKGDTVNPAFELYKTPVLLDVSDTAESITLTSGKLSLVINRRPFSMSFYDDGRFLTKSDTKSLAYINAPDGIFMRERLDLSVGELIYGFGERFGPFVKNGQVVDIWNEDGGTASEISYKNIPFYLSSCGYGVFVNDPGKVSYEIASEGVSKTQFSVPGEVLDYMIIGGGTRSALSRYTALTGKPSLPPYWSFGLWLSTSFTTDYDEKTVMSLIDGMQERDIPLSVFHFDCFWMKAYEWCNFDWDSATFTDAPRLLSRLKERGLRVCVWINPYIGQKSPLFDEAMGLGYMLKKLGGGVWQWDMWQPGMGIVDFSNPEAVKWYQSKLERLLNMGVDCLKTDFGERIPTDVVYFNGANAEKMHNFYTLLYNKVVFELLKAKRGEGEVVLFARSATVGGQQFPVHWGGDSFATYPSMAETLRGGLSLAMCGFGFWSHDIGGFENTATPDLYKRWLAFGLLSTHSRLHGSTSYRVPWMFDDEATDVLRFFAKLKQRLMPYIFAQSIQSIQEGVGVMRPMALMHPEDVIAQKLDLQYYLGESLIVAPIFNDQGVCQYYLPCAEGVYTHLLTSEKRAGGRYHTETYDYYSLPLFVVPNSIIISSCGDDTFELTAYEPTNCETMLYNQSGALAATITAASDESNTIYSITTTDKALTFRIGGREYECGRGAAIDIAAGDF
jgi:alpha-D-xyloside xylohydrolase